MKKIVFGLAFVVLLFLIRAPLSHYWERSIASAVADLAIKKQIEKDRHIAEALAWTVKIVLEVPDANPERKYHKTAGIIFDNSGKVITAQHLFERICDATDMCASVNYTDEEIISCFVFVGEARFPCKPYGRAHDVDVAIVQIIANQTMLENLTRARIGDSGKLKIRDPVCTVGNPLGYDRTYSCGEISGLNRNDDDLTRLSRGIPTGLIQTNAPINPGSSGGSIILDDTGEVVGMAVIGVHANGIGFGLPINVVVKAVEEILQEKAKIPTDMVSGK